MEGVGGGEGEGRGREKVKKFLFRLTAEPDKNS